MPSTFGHALSVRIFGQSHSEAIGCVIEGLPEGFSLDKDALAQFMARRSPGSAPWATPRREADELHIVSGLNPKGETCGAPFCAYIQNTNTKSKDYANILEVPRPGHADFSAEAKFKGAQDVSGGGHFSGRLTAGLCVGGGIAKQILARAGIQVFAHLYSVGDVYDEEFSWRDLSTEGREKLAQQLHTLDALHHYEHAHACQELTTLSEEKRHDMEDAIARARAQQDSLGASIEFIVCGMPKGVGSPMFDGLENVYAQALFGIPAVKGVEFGEGFGVSTLTGSKNNDPYAIDPETDEIAPTTNHAGGILGGISSGACIRGRVAIKPTPSIARAQHSVNLKTHMLEELIIHGRHDPCIGGRACVVVEAVAAFATLDALISFDESAWLRRQLEKN